MSKFQITIVVLLGLILVAIAVPVGLTYWGRWKDYQAFHQAFGEPTPALTAAQNTLVFDGYIRDHATHRWYRGMDASADGCAVTGVAADATFSNCRVPLTGGIPDDGSIPDQE